MENKIKLIFYISLTAYLGDEVLQKPISRVSLKLSVSSMSCLETRKCASSDFVKTEYSEDNVITAASNRWSCVTKIYLTSISDAPWNRTDKILNIERRVYIRKWNVTYDGNLHEKSGCLTYRLTRPWIFRQQPIYTVQTEFFQAKDFYDHPSCVRAFYFKCL